MWQETTVNGSSAVTSYRVGNFILTALAIGQVTLRNTAENLQFALAQDDIFSPGQVGE